MTLEDFIMWLKILIEVLPAIPALIGDVEGAVTQLQSDTTAGQKAKDALAAVNQIGEMITKVIQSL